jgi:type IV pilus assembly protein PilA
MKNHFCFQRSMTIAQRGFTLIELMVVIAIIGIMATMAVPSFQDRIIRAQVTEGVALSEFAQKSVAAFYAKTGRMPTSNEAAGLPPANRIVGSYVESVTVRDGALDIAFGQQSNRNLHQKIVTLRPAVVEGYQQVPVAWICGTATVPERMTAISRNATTVPNNFLPLDCRSMGKVAPATGKKG